MSEFRVGDRVRLKGSLMTGVVIAATPNSADVLWHGGCSYATYWPGSLELVEPSTVDAETLTTTFAPLDTLDSTPRHTFDKNPTDDAAEPFVNDVERPTDACLTGATSQRSIQLKERLTLDSSTTDTGLSTAAAAAHDQDGARGGDGSYPDDNPKTVVGLTKPPTRAIPPVAILHLGGAMGDGEVKYGRFNWRDRRVTASVYYDAMMRHMLAWWDGEDVASDSGRHHLAHMMACAAILLDAEASGKLNDDRRRDGKAAAMIRAMTDA